MELLLSLIITYWYVIPILIVLSILQSAWFKGKTGEFKVNSTASLLLNSNEYHIIKDVTLRTDSGTTQIDHVVVSKFGVFVVETKNLTGWIFGGAKQRHWTQVIYKEKFKFQNPLHQNAKHVRVLRELLGLNNAQIHSVVAFVGDCKFKTELPKNVTKGIYFARYIKSFKNQVFDGKQVSEITEQIESARLEKSRKTNHEHVNNLKEYHKKLRDQQLCPFCSSEMVLRTAKKGKNAGDKFWGCSRYPQCKGTLPV